MSLTSALPNLGVQSRRFDAVSALTCYVVLLMLIPSSLVLGSFGEAGAPAALFAVAVFIWYLLTQLHPDPLADRGRQPMRTAVAVFSCSILAAYVAANRYALPAPQANAAEAGLISLAGWAGVLLLAADAIDGPDRLATLLRRVVAAATAMSVLGVVQFITGMQLVQYIVIPGLAVHAQSIGLLGRDGLTRATSTTAQPLELAAVLAMILPLAIHFARTAARGHRLRRWLQVALLVAGMAATVSRSAMLGLAVAAVVLLPTWRRRERRRLYLTVAAGLLLTWLLKPDVLTSFAHAFGHLGHGTSSTSRIKAFYAAVPYIVQHPWFGRGFQTFFPQTYFYVDNQYLTSLIETGAVGAAALIALFVTGWVVARQARGGAMASAQSRGLAQSLAASVATAAVSFATFDALSFSIAAGVCFLLLGCVGAAWRMARPARQRRAGLMRPAGRHRA